ncbi:MAG: hypothetical protein SFY56_05460 [Bacteroidota bacterium]|nr:hypothetical protein [Bacteroidota bacterium]
MGTNEGGCKQQWLYKKLITQKGLMVLNSSIKKWECIQPNGKSLQVDLCKDLIWITDNTGSFSKTFDEVWNNKLYSVPVNTMQEIYSELILVDSENKNKNCRFWKHINLNLLHPLEYTSETENRKYSLALSKSGMQLSTITDTKNKYQSTDETTDTLNRVFFMGFQQWGVPLEMRRSVREVLLNALSHDSGISITDAFPLIDYDKIKEESFTEKYGELNTEGGSFQHLYKNKIDIGSWDRGSGSSTTVSLERFLLNEWNVQSGVSPLFVKNIKEAIIV